MTGSLKCGFRIGHFTTITRNCICALVLMFLFMAQVLQPQSNLGQSGIVIMTEWHCQWAARSRQNISVMAMRRLTATCR